VNTQVFSIVGGSNGFLLAIIPLLWLSQVRLVRHSYKTLRNVAVALCLKHDFLLPFLSAPLQVLAKELSNKYHAHDSFFATAAGGDDEQDGNDGGSDDDGDDSDGSAYYRSLAATEALGSGGGGDTLAFELSKSIQERTRQYAVDHGTAAADNSNDYAANENDHGDDEEDEEEGSSSTHMMTPTGRRTVHEQDDYDEYEL
jgi:hypothetical protein